MKNQIKKIQELLAVKGKKGIRIKKFQNFWIINQIEKDSPILIYNKRAWDDFVTGVMNHEFEDLAA